MNDSITPVPEVKQNPHAEFVIKSGFPVAVLAHNGGGYIRFFIALNEHGDERLYAELEGMTSDESYKFFRLMQQFGEDLFAEICCCDHFSSPNFEPTDIDKQEIWGDFTRHHHVRRHE